MRVLIQEAERGPGGGATVATIGVAQLNATAVRLGPRVGPNLCGPSPILTEEPETVLTYKVAGKVYVLEDIVADLDGAQSGCSHKLVVDSEDRVDFVPLNEDPHNIIRLTEDYRA